MATVKKPVTTAAAKVEAPKTVKEEAVKEVVKSEPVKAEPVKAEPVKKVAAKKEVTKKAPVKKVAAKKTPAKKTEFKRELHIQFDGKSYDQDDLIKMAKDVWKYDLKKKAGDLVSVELYVKPEENMAYYVMNKEFTGSFYI